MRFKLNYFLIIFFLLTTIAQGMDTQNQKEKTPVPTEVSFIVDYQEHLRTCSVRDREPLGVEHIISRIVKHFAFSLRNPEKIIVLNRGYNWNYVTEGDIENIFGGFRFQDELDGHAIAKLDVTRLLHYAQRGLKEKHSQRQKEIQEEHDIEKGKLMEIIKEKKAKYCDLNRKWRALDAEKKDLEDRLNQKNKWFYQRYPLLTAGCAVLFSMPVYYKLFLIWQNYQAGISS